MTIYSIIPLEMIFAGAEQQTYDFQEVVINGISMQVERVSANQVKIIRLLSFWPNDYLNPIYRPGTVIEYQPGFAT